jgi:type II secretory pathway component PulC
MDKVKKYQQIIIAFLEEYAKSPYLIADILIAEGVERQDIVLGFVPSYTRALSGYAVA